MYEYALFNIGDRPYATLWHNCINAVLCLAVVTTKLDIETSFTNRQINLEIQVGGIWEKILILVKEQNNINTGHDVGSSI